MRNHGPSPVLTLALVLLTLGCGGGGGGNNVIGGPACGVGACGGIVVGTWNVSDLCLDKAALMTEFVKGMMGSCPQASLGDVGFAPTGVLKFNVDLTYSIDFTETPSLAVNIPSSCLAPGTTCAAVDAQEKASARSDPSIQSIACAGSGTCVCTVVEVPIHNTESGTYAISGSSLTTTPSAGTADTSSYCVKAATLTVMNSNSPATGLTAIVATKQ